MVELEPGSIIDDRYQLIKHLGEGGMGSVFYAIELELNRNVAIKILHAGLLTDEEHRTRFEREGRILSSLSHPYILKFYRFGLWQNTSPIIVMEYLEGKNLREELDCLGKLSVARCVSLTRKLCDAMQSAHDAGVIHRDLKPNNVVLLTANNDETPKIVDFGLARALESGEQNQHLTQTGMLVGSVYYMSPEQCTGRKADKRSDIYSLGCVLYECLTGSPPLTADNPIALLHKHATELPVPTAIRLGDSAPNQIHQLTQLDAILFKALAKDPDERYQTMKAFAADLELFDTGKGSEISGALIPKAKRASHLIPILITSAVLMISGTIGAVVFLRPNSKQIPTIGTKSAPRSARGFLGQIEALKRAPDGSEKFHTALMLAKKVEAGEHRITAHETASLYGYLCSMYVQRNDYKTLYGILDKAVDALSKRPSDSMSTAKLLYFRADCAFQRQRYADAEKDIVQCLRLLHSLGSDSADNDLAETVYSRCLRRRKEFARAEQIMLESIARNHSSQLATTQLYTELANIYLAQNKLADERKTFDTALKFATNSDVACLLTMLSEWPQNCNAAGHPELIVDRIRATVQALETLSDAPLQEAYCSAGFTSLLQKGKPESAERYFRLAASQPPKHTDLRAQIYIGLCRSLLRQSKVKEAEQFVAKAIELMNSPDQSEIFLSLGEDCAEANDIDDTNRIVERILIVNKNAKTGLQAAALWNSFTAMWRGLPARYQASPGLEYLRRCISLMKDSSAPKIETATAQQDLSEILIRNNCHQEARNLLQEALPELSRVDSQRTVVACYEIARCCLVLHAIPEADSWINKGLEYARRNNQPTIRTLHQAGNVYNTTGFPDKAGVFYEQAYKQMGADKHERIAASWVLSSFYLQRHRNVEAEKIAYSVLPGARDLAASDPFLAINLLHVLGTIHFNMRKFPEAYRDFEEASKIGPEPGMLTVHSLLLMFDCINMGPRSPETLKQQRKILSAASSISRN